MLKTAGIILTSILLAAGFTGCATASKPNTACFTGWPAGTSPVEVGRRVAENVAA